MADPRFITIEGDIEAEDLLLDMSGDVLDMVTPLEASRAVIAAGVTRRFRTQTDPDGNPWVDWSPDYAKRVAREKEQGIHLGEKLQRSLRLQTQAASEYALVVTADSIFYDFDALPEYGAIQNFGGSAGKGATIPPRPFIGIETSDEVLIEGIFSDWANMLGGATSRGRGAFGQFISLKGSSL